MTLRIAIVILGLLLGLFSHQVAFASGGFDGLYSNKNSFIFAPNLKLKAERHATLIYITADTHEPFMKIAIDKEVMELKQLCGPTLANWATILGSKLQTELLHGRPLTFDLCNFGKLYENVPFPKDLKESINTVYQKYQSNHQMIIPTAIPEIYELILSRLVNRIFNKDKTYFFVHTKAHGTKDFPIINLSNENIEKKHSKQLESFEPKLRKEYADLSENAKLGEGKLASFLKAMTGTPAEHLGTIRNNDLSANISDLTNTEKLFSQKAFEDIFVNLQRQNVIIAFLFLESCSTPVPLDENDRDPRWFIDEVPVLSYYMAKGYLGYNNLEWSRVFQKPDWLTNTPQLMYDSLKTHLPFIENRFSEDIQKKETHQNSSKKPSQEPPRQRKHPILSIYAGENNTCGIKSSSNSLACWGDNEYGKLGSDGQSTKNEKHIQPPTIIDKGTPYSSIALGSEHGCGITLGNILKCWGNSTSGELGRTKETSKQIPDNSPFPVEGSDRYLQVSVTQGRTCGITIQNSLKCWGNNWYGFLGKGISRVNHPSDSLPETIDPQTKYSQVSIGGSHSCGITLENQLRCWGSANDDILRFTEPQTIQIPGVTGFISARVGQKHLCALSNTYYLYCWGDNSFAQVGADASYRTKISEPTLIDPSNRYSIVEVGNTVTCGVPQDNNRILRCWGSEASRFNSLPKDFLDNTSDYIEQVAVGSGHICILTHLNIFCWGDNSVGQLGKEPTKSDLDSKPYLVNAPSPVKDGEIYNFVGLGHSHSCAITAKGVLKCWGSNSHGQLGKGLRTAVFDRYNFVPEEIDQGTKYLRVALGRSHTCGLTIKGQIKCWGSNELGQLGLPPHKPEVNDSSLSNVKHREDYYSPTVIDRDTVYKQISVSDDISCGITSSHKIKCWGSLDGTLRDEKDIVRYGSTPTVIDPEEDYLDISASMSHVCAITMGRQLKCWGDPIAFLRTPKTEILGPTLRIPSPLDTGTKYLSIRVSQSHNCGITTKHQIKCWGSSDLSLIRPAQNVLKQKNWSFSPVAINTPLQFEDLATGFNVTCGIENKNNFLFCWGSKESELLMEETTRGSTSPTLPTTQIDQNQTYKQIAISSIHACGITANGQIKCWGKNSSGQLGIGTNGTPLQR